jgi:hypothetical protein
MPLIKSESEAAKQKNIQAEISAGKNPKQAVAIAYSVQRAARTNGVTTAKGGKGAIGSKVIAPGGEYVHERKAAPDKSARYFTIQKGGKLLRMMKKPGESTEVQSVLTKRNSGEAKYFEVQHNVKTH